MIDFEDDLNEMLSNDDHGVEVVFNHRCFTGISNQEFVAPEPGVDDEERENTVVYVPSAKVKGIKFQDPIQVDKKQLFVLGVQPDGTGMTALVLVDEI